GAPSFVAQIRVGFIKPTLLEDGDELVLVLVERPAAGLILYLDANTDPLEASLLRSIEQIIDIAPTGAQVMQRTRAAIKPQYPTDLYQEPEARVPGGRKLINIAGTTRIAERFGEDHRSAVFAQQYFIRTLIEGT